MQAYQTAPCPYCGATWNPPGAQTCANCRNQLPPPQATYTPPGYPPSQGQPAAPDPSQYPDPNQGYSPPPGYPQAAQPDYGQAPPPDYGQAPPPDYGQQPQPGYPQADYGQQPQPGYSPPQPGYGYQDPGQAYPPGAYPSYSPQPGGYPNYQPPQGYQPDPSGQYAQAPAPAPAAGKTINLLGYPITIPASLLALLPTSMPALPSVALPQVRPGAIVGRLKPLLFIVGAIAVIWVFLTAVVPALATANLQAADQAVAAAVAHQPAVDKMLTVVVHQPTSGIDPMTDPVKAQAANDKSTADVQAALDQVRADESAIGSLDQRLSWLAPVAGAKSQAIASERHRTQIALTALKQADHVLSVSTGRGRELSSLMASMAVWRTMWSDVSKGDWAGATPLYPDAEQKLQTALNLTTDPNTIPADAQYTKQFQDVLENTEKLAEALQAKDTAGITKYRTAANNAIRAQVFDSRSYTGWIVKNLQPLADGYDGGMRGLK